MEKTLRFFVVEAISGAGEIKIWQAEFVLRHRAAQQIGTIGPNIEFPCNIFYREDDF